MDRIWSDTLFSGQIFCFMDHSGRQVAQAPSSLTRRSMAGPAKICFMLGRVLWNGLGFASLGLGLFGVMTPGFPGTVFLILALYFFGKGANDKWRNWMLNHPRFGRILRSWEETRSIPLSIKWVSCTCIVAFSLFSIFVIPKLWVQALVGVLALAGVAYIVTRKTLVNSSDRAVQESSATCEQSG